MRLIGRILIGLVAASLVFIAAGVLVLVATPFGNRLLLDESEAIAASLLPDGVAMVVGGRSIGFTSSGEITLQFRDVVLDRADSQEELATIGEITVGFSLLSALAGDISAEKIIADRLRVDGSGFSQGGNLVVPDVATIFAGLDRAAQNASDLPLKAIEINDLGPLVANESAPRLQRLLIEKTAGGAIVLALAASLQETSVAAKGTATISADGKRLQSFDLATETISLPTATQAGTARPSVMVSLGLGGDVRDRHLKLAAATTAPRESAETIHGSVSIDMKEGVQTADINGTISAQSSLDAAFAGVLDFDAPTTGTLPFRLASTRLISHVAPDIAGLTPYSERSGGLTSRGVFDLSRGAMRIDDAQLTVGKGWLKAKAELTGIGPDDRLTANFQGQAIDAGDLMAFWPFFVAEGPRGWAMDHLHDGRVDTASFDLNLTIARLREVIEPNAPMRDDEFELDLAFSGGGFETLDQVPDLAEASGTVRHRGSHVVVNLDSARVAGITDVTVLPSTIEFQHAGDGVDAALSLNVEGAAGAILALAETQPVLSGAQKSWQPADLAGKAQVGVGVGFHLADGPGVSKETVTSAVHWSVVAELKGVDLLKPIDGRKVSGLIGTAMIAEGSAIGEFSGRIDDVPANVTFAQPIGKDPVGEPSLKIVAQLDDGAIARLAPALAETLGGRVSVELAREKAGFIVTADLSDAVIRLPQIGWSKSAGVPGTLTLQLEMDGSVKTIRNAVLSGQGFSASGSAELDAAGLKTLVLDSLALNPGDSLSARMTRLEGGIGIRLAANGMDARPILAALQNGFNDAGSGTDRGSAKMLVELSAAKLRGFGGEALDKAEVRFEADGDLVRAASVAGSIRGVPVSMVFRPGTTKGPAIRLETDNAGALLRFSGLYDKMQDGRLNVSLGRRDSAFAGQVTLANFTLADEERLRSLVGTARQSADSLAARLGKDVSVASAYFDTARANLKWDNGQLMVDSGIIRGPVFGSSFAGTLIDPSGRIDMAGSFMPAYGLNRLFGALPFVGGVLGNGGEGGLIGITYRLEGTLSDPTLIVNPISLIAPGIFRRIFEF